MTAPTKVLFLDIDGVLNSERTCEAHRGYPFTFSEADMKKFDHVAIDLIRKLCEQTSASIVLSSAWRQMFPVCECANGLDLPIFDRTPSLPGPRGMEIQAWLVKHPEVTTYAIVDDNADMLPEQQGRFVQTSWEDGLSVRNYRTLHQLLSTPLTFEETA